MNLECVWHCHYSLGKFKTIKTYLNVSFASQLDHQMYLSFVNIFSNVSSAGLFSDKITNKSNTNINVFFLNFQYI